MCTSEPVNTATKLEILQGKKKKTTRRKQGSNSSYSSSDDDDKPSIDVSWSPDLALKAENSFSLMVTMLSIVM